jgi:hypothetical protein
MNEQTGTWKFAFDYYGWYPVIGFEVTNGNRNTTKTDSVHTEQIHWNETNLSLSIKIPLNLTHGKWITGLQPYLGWDYRIFKMKPGSNYHFNNPYITTVSSQLYFYNQLMRSPKDIYPKWGQQFSASYRTTLFLANQANQTAVQGTLFLPGIIRHQGLSLFAGYEHNTTGDYYFQNQVPVPRGYSHLFFKSFVSLKSGYVFPVAYPDWNMHGIWYLKRIYGQAFYDYLNTTTAPTSTFSITGLAVFTNWHFLSLFPNISLGVRWNYRIEEKNSTFDYLFNIQF